MKRINNVDLQKIQSTESQIKGDAAMPGGFYS